MKNPSTDFTENTRREDKKKGVKALFGRQRRPRITANKMGKAEQKALTSAQSFPTVLATDEDRREKLS
ncbi:hypothetical protein U1Q18_036659 [Sarracenia purpurea var. burkii]